MPAQTKRPIVLVHGAWHGGWCWRDFARLMRARGHDVYTPTMTGLGERSHLMSGMITLDTHIRDIVNVFKWEDIEDAVLVLHSYAGWPGTGAADELADRIHALVYLDAFVPEDGQSNLVMQTPERLKIINEALARHEVSRPAPASEHFAIANPEHLEWVRNKMTPQPLGVTFSQIRLTGACENIPVKAYIRGSGYGNTSFDSFLHKYVAQPGWRTWDLPCGHHVMLDMPERLAEIVDELAA